MCKLWPKLAKTSNQLIQSNKKLVMRRLQRPIARDWWPMESKDLFSGPHWVEIDRKWVEMGGVQPWNSAVESASVSPSLCFFFNSDSDKYFKVLLGAVIHLVTSRSGAGMFTFPHPHNPPSHPSKKKRCKIERGEGGRRRKELQSWKAEKQSIKTTEEIWSLTNKHPVRWYLKME